MNKEKLVELADEVLSHVDMDIKVVLRNQLERDLCGRLSEIFQEANRFLVGHDSMHYKQAYASVRPILDDCIDRILGEKKWLER